MKGTKRYGRRSRPDSKPDGVLTDFAELEDSPPSRTEATDSSPAGVRRAKLRRSTSLESVEVRRSVHPHLPVAPLHLTWFLSKIDSIVLRGAERRDAAGAPLNRHEGNLVESRALSRTTVFSSGSCRRAGMRGRRAWWNFGVIPMLTGIHLLSLCHFWKLC